MMQNITFSLVFTGHIFTLELTEFNLVGGGGGLFRVKCSLNVVVY